MQSQLAEMVDLNKRTWFCRCCEMGNREIADVCEVCGEERWEIGGVGN